MICPVCNVPSEGKVAKTEGEYRLIWCRACDVIFADPFKNPGSEWYKSFFFYQYGHSPLLLFDSKMDWSHKRFLRDRISPGGALLDVGCGTGKFLKAARDSGYRVAGIDFNEEEVGFARDYLGLKDVYVSSLEQYVKDHPGSKFDVVTFFEVLEHVDDPGSFVENAKALLRPGGWVALSVPYRDRWPRFELRVDHPPHHLTYWSKIAISRFLQSHGFTLREYETGCTGAEIWMSQYVPQFRIGQRLTEKVTPGASVGNSDLRWLKTVSLLPRLKQFFLDGCLYGPANILLKVLGATGTRIYAIAQKK